MATLKILSIGNSFSVDAHAYLWNVLTQSKNGIITGNANYPGCSLDKHWSFISCNQQEYTYSKNISGTMVDKSAFTVDDALHDEEWDIITLQQASSQSGLADTYGHLDDIINYVKQAAPQAKLFWHMTWAYQGNSEHSGFPAYNRNQMTMYRAIVDCVQSIILPNKNICGVIPAGTAIQNLRTSYLGDTLTVDGFHMSHDFGRYTVALMWAKTLLGDKAEAIDWTPDSCGHLQNDFTVIREAIKNADRKPFEVTESVYSTR